MRDRSLASHLAGPSSASRGQARGRYPQAARVETSKRLQHRLNQLGLGAPASTRRGMGSGSADCYSGRAQRGETPDKPWPETAQPRELMRTCADSLISATSRLFGDRTGRVSRRTAEILAQTRWRPKSANGLSVDERRMVRLLAFMHNNHSRDNLAGGAMPHFGLTRLMTCGLRVHLP